MSLEQEALEVLKKHGKAAALDLIPLLADKGLDEAAKAIPGQVDDVIIGALKEPLKKAMADLLAKV
jgi:hypothetical protein